MRRASGGAAARLLACGLAAIAACGALAQDYYPTRPVQMLVSFPAGSIVDIMARPFAQIAEQTFGQRIVVVNRPGGSQTIAMNGLMAAPADGYNWVYTPVTPVTIHPHRMKLAYTPESFIPMCQTFENVFYVAVGPHSPFKALRELVDAAKAKLGHLKYATAGIASSPHLAGAELWQRLGASLVDVPFAAMDASTIQTLVKGNVESGIVTTHFVVTQKLRPLAVFAAERQKRFPDVPTVTELGHPIPPSGYGGVFVRQGTPPAIVTRIDEACRRAATDPQYRDIAEKQFQAATYLDSQAFSARVDADSRAIAKLIPTLNLPAN
jgi:tripartite-type tricarboxylate transporter receptor subunit TctC